MIMKYQRIALLLVVIALEFKDYWKKYEKPRGITSRIIRGKSKVTTKRRFLSSTECA